MRNAWNEDPQYIVNLTRNLIGEKTLSSIIKENPEADPQRIRSYVWLTLPKLQVMRADTLGYICAYASASGAHCGKHSRGMVAPKFINSTGLIDVFPSSQREEVFCSKQPGELQVYIALGVLISVVTDMIRQTEWQAQWPTWELTEVEEKWLRDHPE
ncbi:MAG: hypothetical protein PHG25_00310 [Candidatus Pacebacteria bacterium]|nr:hypothetical protein [Candidatus Paceibacterota bacterium]